MRRVLLTGAGGFVGSHCLRHFLENTDWHLILTDSFRRQGSLDRIVTQMADEPFRDRLTIVAADLAHPFSPQAVAAIGHVDDIVNVASDSDVDKSISDPRDCIENNVGLILTMLDFARERGVGQFLQISTDEVYGPAPNSYRHREGEPHRPSNGYSASKAAQEDICYAYRRTYGVPVTIVNCMNLIGEMQHVNKFVPKTLAKILRGETVQIHAAPDGKIGSRFYLHARNLADALFFLLERDFSPLVDLPRFNVVGEREVNNLQMAELIAETVGKWGWDYDLVDAHSSRPGHDLRYALDGSKIAAYGWRPPVSFEDSLRKTVLWTLDHPEWLEINYADPSGESEERNAQYAQTAWSEAA